MPLDAIGVDSWIDLPIDSGCRYILDAGATCGTAQRSRSSYCQHHHNLCHLSADSAAEATEFRNIAALVNRSCGSV
jgi:hypothetical protein